MKSRPCVYISRYSGANENLCPHFSHSSPLIVRNQCLSTFFSSSTRSSPTKSFDQFDWKIHKYTRMNWLALLLDYFANGAEFTLRLKSLFKSNEREDEDSICSRATPAHFAPSSSSSAKSKPGDRLPRLKNTALRYTSRSNAVGRQCTAQVHST